MTLLIFSVVYLGLASFAMSMNKHFKSIWQQKPKPWQRYLLQIFGWATLLISFWMCLVSWDKGMGPAVWFGLFTMAGFLFTMVFSYFSQRAYYLIPILPTIGAFSLAL